jgi:hypothetical protein
MLRAFWVAPSPRWLGWRHQPNRRWAPPCPAAGGGGGGGAAVAAPPGQRGEYRAPRDPGRAAAVLLPRAHARSRRRRGGPLGRGSRTAPGLPRRHMR